MKHIGVDSKGDGLGQQSVMLIIISAAIILIVFTLLIVSVVANIYLRRKIRQNGNHDGHAGERVPLVHEGKLPVHNITLLHKYHGIY